MDFFGIGLLELLVILVVALLVMGPQRLPEMANRLGILLGRARRSVAEAREAFLLDLEQERAGRREQAGSREPPAAEDPPSRSEGSDAPPG